MGPRNLQSPPSRRSHHLPVTLPRPRCRPLRVSSQPLVPLPPRPLPVTSRAPPVPTSPRLLRTRRAPPRCRRHHWPGGKSFSQLILRPRESRENFIITVTRKAGEARVAGSALRTRVRVRVRAGRRSQGTEPAAPAGEGLGCPQLPVAEAPPGSARRRAAGDLRCVKSIAAARRQGNSRCGWPRAPPTQLAGGARGSSVWCRRCCGRADGWTLEQVCEPKG